MNDSKHLSFGCLPFLFALVLILGYVNGGGVSWADPPKETPTAVSAPPCPAPAQDTSGWEEHKIILPKGTLQIRLPKGWQKAAHLPRFYPRGEEDARAIEADFWKRGADYFFQYVQDEDSLPVGESRVPEEVTPSQYAHCEEPLQGRKSVIETRILLAKDLDDEQMHLFYQAAVTLPIAEGRWLVISGTSQSPQAQEQLLRSFRTIRIKE
jgi:hypothetical protein